MLARPHLNAWRLALLCATCLAGQCSGGGAADGVTSGPTCDELCGAAAKCSEPPESAAACHTLCDGQRATYNQTAWSAYSACVDSSACQSVDDCMQEAVAATPDAPVDNFLREICGWAVGCAGGLLTEDKCVDMFRDIGDEDAGADASSPWDFVRLLRGSLVSCISGCIRGLSCGETDFGAASAMCASRCDLDGLGVFGSDGTGGTGDPTCEEEHGDCGAHGQIMENEYGGCDCKCDDTYVVTNWVCEPGCQQTGCGGHGECDAMHGTCNCDDGYYATPGVATGACTPRPRYVSFGTTEDSGCAVRDDGAVECWGNSSDAVQEIPEPNEGFVNIAMGSSALDSSACALRDDGDFVCWGGIAQPDRTLVPRLLSISLNDDHACGVRPDKSVYCWGFDAHGVTSPTDRENYDAVAIGDRIACGIHVGGALACWGDDAVVSQMPAGIDDAEQVCANSGGACVRRQNGAIECFGFASYASMKVPTPNSGFVDVTCGGYHACAVRDDGIPTCWGNDIFIGQLVPPEDRRTGYTDLEAADDHTCGLRDDGSLSCWGRSTYNEAPENRTAHY